MKKILAAILISIMALGLIGCGKKEQTNGEDETQKNEQTTEAVTEADTNTDEDAATDAEDEEKEDNENNGDDSDKDLKGEELAEKLASIFEEEIAKGTDIETIANSMVSIPQFMCGVTEVEEGFLSGFSEDVKGFKKGYSVGPMIGTIAFATYIFETDDANALQETLKSLANPRWNICTEATEPLIKVHENTVFVTMCPVSE